MKLDALIGSWHDTRRLLAMMTAMALVLTLSVAVLAMQLIAKERTVVLVPPHLTSEMEVARHGVTEDYLRTWGLFIAHTIGNVTPGTVETARTVLEPMLAPAIYRGVIERMEAEIEKITRDRVVLRFEPKRVGVDVKAGRVWVEGHTEVDTIGEGSGRGLKTYVFLLENQGYAPLITGLQTYEGAARVEEDT
ncbi:MAG: TraE/TraK family type IV conjugative transfer system protein [Pseudomonadota bacterium]